MGKTTAFIIPILQKIDFAISGCQVLILAPTRELAVQIEMEIKRIGVYLPLRIHLYVGLPLVQEDIPQIVVSTPVRANDLIGRGLLNIDHIQTVVVDEAAEVISRGYTDCINTIFTALPPSTQYIIVSVHLMNDTVFTSFMHNPININGWKHNAS